MVRVLFLSANPEGTDKLQLIKECNNIYEKIRSADHGSEFQFDQRHEVSVSQLQDYLLDLKPQIVHFSGHGSDTGNLVFQDEDGSAEEASIDAVKDLFKVINHDSARPENKIRIVVLNACYSDALATAISEHVDCVVGMSSDVTDESARIFAEAFYRALGYGKSVQEAFDFGCNEVGLEGREHEHIPMLRTRHGIDASSVRFVTMITSSSVNETTALINRITNKKAVAALVVIAISIIGIYALVNAVTGLSAFVAGDVSVIEGNVKLRGMGSPVDNAKVVLDDSRTGYTDDGGVFSFDAVAKGNHKLQVVTEEGSVLFTRTFDVAGGSETKNLGDIFLDDYPRQIAQPSQYSFWEPIGISIDDGTFVPEGITFDSSGNAYVVDTANSQVLKFSNDRAFDKAWGSHCRFTNLDNVEEGWTNSECDGKFASPDDIVLDSNGFLYVLDQNNDRIIKYTADGELVSQWFFSDRNRLWNFPGGYALLGAHIDAYSDYVYSVIENPRSFASQPEHEPYVTKFDDSGNMITQWGEDCNLSLVGEDLCRDPDGITGPLRHGDANLFRPSDVAVDPSGFLYIPDGYDNRIKKFTGDGTFVTAWGSTCRFGFWDLNDNDDDGIYDEFVDFPSEDCVDPDADGPLELGDGQFRYPDRIAVDANGYVYVADTINDKNSIIRIQKFTSDGEFISKWKIYKEPYERVGNLFIDVNGKVYVPLPDINRIAILS